MKALLILALALLATGCAKPPIPEPIVRTVEVLVPVPVPCRPDVGPEPVYADDPALLAAAPDVFEAMKLRIAGREQRRAREAVLVAALAGCAGVTLTESAQP